MNKREAWRLLRWLDRLTSEQLIELGAYLMVCGLKKSKPTVGTQPE
jgi:phage/plasmid-associated DNA primase